LAFPSIGPIARSALIHRWKFACGALLACLTIGTSVFADNAAPQPVPIPVPATQPQGVNIQVLYVKEDREKELPLSLLDQPNADDGIAGAKLGIADNNTTGRFLNQTFKMDVLEGNLDDLIKGATEKVAAGDAFIIADMEPDSLLKFADAMKNKPAQIFNVGNPDDRLREEDCRPNVMHTAPTRTQLADTLAQYLVWKRWPNWLMVVGPSPNDQLLADAYRRAAKKFGAKIVEERQFKVDTGNRRADGGFEQIQQQIPQFMQGAKDHDVVLVIDEDQVFADYFAYRTWLARPIVGSAGLVPSSWHPALELWGGTQFQNRFKRLTGRIMRPLDYDAWVATRAIGEAASRKQTSDFKTLRDFMHSANFEVAAFKGVATSFRSWNGQLREPLIVSTPKLLVSVSPQQGFLHQFSVLDTLGIDRPETKCKAYTQ
jgi:ABC transporter substrate binding protein (PQQ-dependent alcohol dehydrogenase system)